MKLASLLKEAGFKARIAAAGRVAEKHVPDEILVEVQGYLAKDDPRLATLVADEAIDRVSPIGGFANPLPLAKAAG